MLVLGSGVGRPKTDCVSWRYFAADPIVSCSLILRKKWVVYCQMEDSLMAFEICNNVEVRLSMKLRFYSICLSVDQIQF